MRIWITILLLFSLGATAQNNLPFANGRATDTAHTPGALYAGGPVRIPYYANTDVTKVLTADANGFLYLITVSGGGGGAVNTVFGRAGNVVAQVADYSAYYELLTNKVTSFASPNNTTYPTTAAVNGLVANYMLANDSNAYKGYVAYYYAEKHYVHYTDTAAMLAPYRRSADSGFNGGYSSYYYSEHTYLKTFTETDPIFTVSAAHGIAGSDITNWNTAYADRLATLTTTGSSGAATFSGNTLNIPTPTLAGLGGIGLTALSGSAGVNYNSTTGAFTLDYTNAGTFTNAIWHGVAVGTGFGGTGATTATSVNTTPITYGANNTIPASANTLTTTTLNPTVVHSSLTDVGTLTAGALGSGFTAVADGQIASAANWNTAYTNRITSLTTTGSSGAATLVSNVLNIPTPTLAGLGGVASTRSLTINGTAFDLSADRSWSVGTVTSVGLGNITGFTTATGTPVTGSGTLGYSLTNAGAHQYWGNNTGSSAAPAYYQINFTDLAGTATSGQLPADVAYLDIQQLWTKSQASQWYTLTDAATVAWDMSQSNNLVVQLGGNRTLGVPTNVKAGTGGNVVVWQDATGSRTLAYSWCYTFPGGSAPTLTTGSASKGVKDLLPFEVLYYNTSTSVTATNASPCVFTWTAHGLLYGSIIQFTSATGLPTGVSANTTYWLNVTGANTFNIATSLANLQAGTYVNSSSTGTGINVTALEIIIGNALNVHN